MGTNISRYFAQISVLVIPINYQYMFLAGRIVILSFFRDWHMFLFQQEKKGIEVIEIRFTINGEKSTTKVFARNEGKTIR